MKSILKFIWQLPQNLIGLLVVLITKAEKKEKEFSGVTVRYYLAQRLNKKWSGVSLGNYIIIAKRMYETDITVKHEYGHQRQSLYLGWLYVFVIGLPSLIGNLLHRKFKFDYYKQPYEHWADELGGVKR